MVYRLWLLTLILAFPCLGFSQIADFYPINSVVPNNDGTKAILVTRQWIEKKKSFEYHHELADFKTGTRKKLPHEPLQGGNKVAWSEQEDMIFFFDNRLGDGLFFEFNLKNNNLSLLKKFSGQELIDFEIKNDHIAFITLSKNKPLLADVSGTGFVPKQNVLIWDRKKNTEILPNQLGISEGLTVTHLVWVPSPSLSLVLRVQRKEKVEEDWRAEILEVDPTSRKMESITGPNLSVSVPVVSPDGKFLAYALSTKASDDPEVTYRTSQIEIYNRANRKRRSLPLTFDGEPKLSNFTPDQQAILFKEPYMAKMAVHRIDLSTGKVETWKKNEKTSEHFAYSNDAGSWIGLISESAACGPRPILLSSDFKIQKELHEKTQCLGGVEDLDLSWKAKDGQLIHGIVNRPPSGKVGPLLVIPHGGPTFYSYYQYLGTAYHHGVPIDIRAFLGAGFTVFRPNIRGSIGYGPDFRKLNAKDLGGKDWLDIESGIQELVNLGWVKPNEYAIAGWSYGGFLCALGAVETQLFKAAACGASVTDWISHDLTSRFTHFVPYNFGTQPREIAKLFPLLIERSPALSERESSAPLLLIHGKEDRAVGFGQSLELFRWAQRRDVPVKFLAYPEQDHRFERFDYIREASEEVVRWITSYLKD